MIGDVVESRPAGAGCAVSFLIAGVLFGTLMVFAPKKDAWPVGALPFGVAAGILLSRGRPTVFRVEETQLQFEQPTDEVIRYEDLEAVVTTGDRRGRFPIQLNHNNGATVIPDRLSVSSEELLAFLESKLPRVRKPPIPSALIGYRDEQAAKFGEERVYSFVGRPKAIHRPSYTGVGAMLGFAVAAVVMAAVGTVADPRNESWLGAGLGLALFGVFIAFVLYVSGRALKTSDARAGLVVTPVGIAMVQGDSKGKLRWDEVRAIEHPPVKRMGTARTANSRNGIGLLVDGAYIIILDYYNRPAEVIYDLLHDYWNGGRPA